MSENDDWLIHIDFYELDDYQVRVDSKKNAVALVSRWIAEGCVSKTEWPRGADPSKEENRVEVIIPIAAVKRFDIRCLPVPADRRVITVSGVLPQTP